MSPWLAKPIHAGIGADLSEILGGGGGQAAQARRRPAIYDNLYIEL